MDDAFCWWRWLEYSGSCSLMGMLIAVTLGIREQNILSALFMLMWCVQMFGLLTELNARPGERGPDGYRGWANDPPRTETILMLERKRRAALRRAVLIFNADERARAKKTLGEGR